MKGSNAPLVFALGITLALCVSPLLGATHTVRRGVPWAFHLGITSQLNDGFLGNSSPYPILSP